MQQIIYNGITIICAVYLAFVYVAYLNITLDKGNKKRKPLWLCGIIVAVIYYFSSWGVISAFKLLYMPFVYFILCNIFFNGTKKTMIVASLFFYILNYGLQLALAMLMLMKEIPVKLRVKVLLAQALFGNPDVLLLDEPTNSLDVEAISWLEEFLINFNNTVIVVSHDRHFLNKVCTHIADLDYNKIKLYIGNYDFWYESSQLALKQMKEANKKKEDKIKELQDFIARFSANASKSKQATSRKKMLEKIQLDEIVPSSRKYPFIDFKIEKPVGKEILKVTNLTKEVDGKKILNKVSFTVLKGDKINIVADDDLPKTALFNIIMGIDREYKGSYEWGKTIVPSYLPQDNSAYFKDNNKNIMEWIGSFYDIEDETVLRGFLGRMLFSGDDVFKKVDVLSGGEKARCMLSKCMLENPNFLVLDEPTNHLDLESITALNKGLVNFTGSILLTSRDHELNSTVTNRIIEIKDDGSILDRYMTYDEYLESKK